MVKQDDLAVLREILRQGERMLTVQQDTIESALRRAGELLRLGVATLGGLVIVTGLMSAAGLIFGGYAIGATAIGVTLVVFSVFVLSTILAGHRGFGVFAYGPDVERIVDATVDHPVEMGPFLMGLTRNLPEMIQVNASSIARTQKAKGSALVALTLGSLIILGTILFIIVGSIHG